MSELGTKLHVWLDSVDDKNSVAWYEHVVARDFACGCKPWSVYCAEWQSILNPRAGVGTFWIHTNSTPVTDEMLRLEAGRRKYVVLNSWQGDIARKLKTYNPAAKCFAYKCASSTRSYDLNTNWQMLPAGVSYQWANANRPDWFLKNLSSGQRIQWSYSGHWQMDVGNPDYQNMWAANVIGMKDHGFDGIWIDNLLWRRSDYRAYPGQYATDDAFRAAYRSFIGNVTTKIRSAGMLSVGNLNGARLITGGWASYLDAGLDGGWDEFWLSVDNTGNNLLPEYPEGWGRLISQIEYAEAHGKIAMVQPHFPAGNKRAFDYTLASYLMAAEKESAYTEANGTDAYGNPTPWHTEFDWNLGAPLGLRHLLSANVWRRGFANGVAVVNVNAKDTNPVAVSLGGTYYDSKGVARTSVTLSGCMGAILKGAP